jgi:hypothetical protein
MKKNTSARHPAIAVARVFSLIDINRVVRGCTGIDVEGISVTYRSMSLGARFLPVAVLGFGLISGCSAFPLEDLALRKPPPPTISARSAQQTAVMDKDGYPNISTPLVAANSQMTDGDAAALQAQLTALGQQRKAGTLSEAQYKAKVAELRKLAQTHGTNMETQIQQ